MMREVIPWEKIVKRLSNFYDKKKGPVGKSLRIMVALLIVQHLRGLSDVEVIKQAKENRYIQYFCNIPDKGLQTFLNDTTLCKFRQRLSEKGVQIIESEVFNLLRRTGVISGEDSLIDSTVLESNIAYPNDVDLIMAAFEKMINFANSQKMKLWWDHEEVKQLWREFNLGKKSNRLLWLGKFYLLFLPVLSAFKTYADNMPLSKNVKKCQKLKKRKERAKQLYELLNLLMQQTKEKLEGKESINNRIVSLNEVDARPIKKGKSHPSCEFGTTLQMSFNRDGFIVTVENFIGKPDDSTLYIDTLKRYAARMHDYPNTVVTDLGYRSADNIKDTPEDVNHLFLGRSTDVVEERQEFCHKARSATEGFIAVAKHWHGFGRSLYRGFKGDQIWSLLCQTISNLKKFVQLFREECIEEESLVKLGLA